MVTGETELGSLLNRLRTTRGWSLREVARRSGISQSSLTRWEQGRFAPRLPELEMALAALGATPSQRRSALKQLNRPRSLLRLSEPDNGDMEQQTVAATFGPMPSGSDLLRAIRLRNRLSSEEAAGRIGVAARSIRRWEQGETWPGSDLLTQVCRVLNAHEAETCVLMRGRGSLEWRENIGCPLDGDLIADRIRAIYNAPGQESCVLSDLRYLAMASMLWPLACRDPQALPLLYLTLASHARYLMERGRIAESGKEARRALAVEDCLPDSIRLTTSPMFSQMSSFGDQHCEVVLASAAALLHSDASVHRRRGRQLLIEEQALWPRPAYQAWMLSTAADSLAEDKETRAALELSRKAMGLALCAPDPFELLHRRRDHATLLTKLGQYAEALHTLESAYPLTAMGADPMIRHLLIEAECKYGLRAIAASDNCLDHADSIAQSHQVTHLQPRIQATAKRLHH